MQALLGNAAAILLVAGLLILSVRTLVKDHQAGGCSGCSGSCASCGKCSHAAPVKKSRQN